MITHAGVVAEAGKVGEARPWRPLGLDELPLRTGLRGLTPYEQPHPEVPVRLHLNENPYPPSVGLVDALGKAATLAATQANRYPDPGAEALRADLAYYLTMDAGFGLHTAQIWVANGIEEITQQLCQAFGGPGRVAVGFEPSNSMHRRIALDTATEWISEKRATDFALSAEVVVTAIERHRPTLVFLGSPNNPTGAALPLDVVMRACEAVQTLGSGMVIVDEAYAEFRRPGVPSALSLLPAHPRLIIARTMSSAFALAGARVGYLAAHPAVVDALQLVRLPYHLSSFTQALARTVLAHADELLSSVDAVKSQRDRVVKELLALGLRVTPSDANFVFFGQFADQRAVWRALVAAGILVRDVGHRGWLRASIGLPSEVDVFLAALGRIVAGAEVGDDGALQLTSGR